jgi:hypothetical protein
MRIALCLFSCLFALPGASAQALSETDREALLESLEKLRESVDSRVDAKYRLALAAYRKAAASDDAAMELYLNCIEKVNFQDRSRKAADFRDWKRKESDRLSEPGFRLALRHQLRWLMLTLQAASEKSERTQLAADAQGIVDAIFRDAEKLGNQRETLGQAVTASIFARAYEISSVKVENWPLSPIQLDQVYNDVLLPPHRTASRVSSLRSGWIKRIQQETKIQEYWAGTGRDARSASTPSPQYVKFIQEALPSLQWQMELDLFRHGDESGAASRMFAHLEKNISHASVRNWTDQFRTLLSSRPAAVTTAPSAADE